MEPHLMLKYCREPDIKLNIYIRMGIVEIRLPNVWIS